MSYDNNNHQDSEGSYQAGPYVAPPPVSYPMRYGPQHHQQPPPPPEKTKQRGDEFCTGCCCCCSRRRCCYCWDYCCYCCDCLKSIFECFGICEGAGD
ncbi:hypothetical protein POPTR_012G120584v4 [Populus trichocarpa]|uniref:Uncharacterized protein n=2 Tax=Populus trichocarpa TaxID=3694 RepID=A0ACC0S6D4_POPTR|nr:protein CYSTEINE-RICH TRANSMEMBRANE MODULE 9 [Populus trichocarpa]KAI9384854.1 hypothetical protein POPTR_012G120584v4 [Populus trichocarpa]